MEYIASFDVGTTNVKGILVTREGRIAGTAERPIRVLESGGRMEQQPEDWADAVFQILHEWYAEGTAPEAIRLVSLSGQMQDLIALDEQLRPVRPAILYADGRAGKEAAELLEQFGHKRVDDITGNPFNGTLVLPKLLWMKRHEPETYERTAHVLISAKDLIVARLTGQLATDLTSASTAGCMDLRAGSWSGELIEGAGISLGSFPRILAPGEVAGTVNEPGARLSGLLPGTPVLCGFGDAGASTIGAGVLEEGQAYLYLGTTGWAATASRRQISTRTGAFNLAFYRPDLVVAIAPLLNVGNVHRWAKDTFGMGEAADDFAAFDRMVASGLAKLSGSTGQSAGSGPAGPEPAGALLFLPYLNGERCPVQDPLASGCYVGIRQGTTREEMAAAALEGVTLSVRQVMDILQAGQGTAAEEITAIGGGTKSRVWCQLLADVLQMTVHVPEDSPYLPALGAAVLGFPVLGWNPDLKSVLEQSLGHLQRVTYVPDRSKRAVYQEKYSVFQRLYPVLQTLWNN